MMKKFALAGIPLLLLPYLALAASPEPRPVRSVIIDDNPGGGLDTFVYWFGALRDSGVPVILRGVCESACTLILMLPRDQVCVEPTASLGFHLATTAEGESAPSVTQAMIRRRYPMAVRRWLIGKVLVKIPIYMTAHEMVSLGIFPACPVEAAL